MEMGRPLKLISAAAIYSHRHVFILIPVFCIIKIQLKLCDESLAQNHLLEIFFKVRKKKFMSLLFVFGTSGNDQLTCPGLGHGEDKVDFYSSLFM